MNRLSHQPRILVLAIAAALGLVTLGAGCSKGQNNNTGTMPATPATAHAMPPATQPRTQPTTPPPMTPAMPATTNGANNGGMSAGIGNSNQPVSDTWITTKVEAKLHTIDGLNNGDITVETNNGIVTLTGKVKSKMQLDTVVRQIKTIKGVKNVETSRVHVGNGTP